MNNNLLLPLILQAVGVAVIIAEFILPSAGLLTLTAIAAFAYSIFHVFYYISPEIGMYFIGADVIMIPIAIVVGMKLIAKSPVTLRKALTKKNGVTSQDDDLQQMTGLTGTALTDLRPAGKAIIDGRRMDVVSSGDYIEKGASVVVSAVNGNRVVVKRN
jgi:membrane-bound serine protease (ClpP class)